MKSLTLVINAIIVSLCLSFSSLVNASTCPSTCNTLEEFILTNSLSPTEPLPFCGAYIDYTFCPRSWLLQNVTYTISEMDKFAEEKYNIALQNHQTSCDSSIPSNPCGSCAAPLKRYFF